MDSREIPEYTTTSFHTAGQAVSLHNAVKKGSSLLLTLLFGYINRLRVKSRLNPFALTI